MKSIEEAAEKYAGATQLKSDYPHHKQSSYDGFKAEVEFAQRWFDIYEEEPEYYQRILADNGEYMSVAARVSDGEEDSYIIHGTDFYMNPDPIKWKPIELKDVDIENLQIINGQNQLSKDIQAQLILFEGQCKMNAMLACNMQRGACNESMGYNDYDFIDLQKEIECRINELK